MPKESLPNHRDSRPVTRTILVGLALYAGSALSVVEWISDRRYHNLSKELQLPPEKINRRDFLSRMRWPIFWGTGAEILTQTIS